jgi:hypothetical protein
MSISRQGPARGHKHADPAGEGGGLICLGVPWFPMDVTVAFFVHKGTNGRWRDVLTAEDVEHDKAVAAARLSSDCAHWLETGELP